VPLILPAEPPDLSCRRQSEHQLTFQDVKTLSSLFYCSWLIVVLGCGGSSGAAPSSQSAPGSESSAAPQGASGADSGNANLSKHREEFMTKCTSAFQGAPDYCQCSWDLLLRVFDEKALASDAPDPAKLAEYKQKLPAACGGKVPEPVAHEKFMEGCGKEGELHAYCECSWTELRKTLSVGDLVLPESANSPRVVAATKGLAKSCGDKLPEKIARDAFLQGCNGERPGTEKFCECAWKQVRAVSSAAEIFAGSADLAQAQPKIKEKCGKLLPEKS